MKRGVKRPPGFPFTLNNAIDYMLKLEFDKHREEGTAHRIIKENNIDAIPYNCPEINTWRANFTGVQYEHKPTGFLVTGAVDDVWVTPEGELIVVDYKATGAKEHRIYDSYKRQMEVYQWLLEKIGNNVSKMGYFLFAKVNKDKGFGEAKMSFDIFLEPMKGDTGWVEGAVRKARELYNMESAPKSGAECECCPYAEAWGKETGGK